MNQSINQFHADDFRIIKALGSKFKRKFNDVFLSEHKTTGQKSVLKHLSKTSENQAIQELIRFEASLEFKSTFLPKTLLTEETENEILFFKSYATGIPLDEYWKTIPKKDREGFVWKLFQKLAPLFDELEEKKLVHGDIKPGNLIIEAFDSDFNVYLIDFGLSFYSDRNPARPVLFALSYSAPELILNKLHLANQSSDLFSLGICIWQLFEEKLPLSHPNPAIMTNLQLTHPLPAGDRISSSMNRILQKMCFKASFPKPPNLLKNEDVERSVLEARAKRYQNLHEILEDSGETENKATKEGKSFWGSLIKIFTDPKVEGKE